MEAILETERLKLRPYRIWDAARLAEYIGDFDVAKMLARVPHPYTQADARDFITQVGAGVPPFDAANFVIDREGLIGAVGLSEPKQIEGETIMTLGYWLAKPHWRSGFATEAARAVVDHAFKDLGVAGLISGHFKDNHASGRVLTKLGFRYAGEGTKYCLARDEKVAHVDVVLTRADWAAFRTARAA